jgi:DNA repair protein RecN (Recombination protein N)
MLRSLRVENLALIEALELDLADGLCLLTGETGAGKSILVEALGLLCGDRADADLVRTGTQEAVVEATFDTGESDAEVVALLDAWQVPCDGELVLRRRLQSSGRSAATVNGASVSVAQLRELGPLLVTIHGQHQSRSLLDEETHRDLLDAQPSVAPHAAAVAAAHRSLAESLTRLRALQRGRADRDQRLDAVRYQRDEIDRVAPKAGEEEELLLQKNRLQHAERIVEDAGAVATLLRDGEVSAQAQTVEALRRLEDLAEVDPSWKPFTRDLRDVSGVLSSIASEAERVAATTVFDPEALEAAQARLADLDRLKRKYGPALEDVLAHREKLEAEFLSLSGSGSDPEAAEKEVREGFRAYIKAASALGQARASAAKGLAESVLSELKPLALEKARFLVELVPKPAREPAEARPTGFEDVRFLFSANPGEPPKPLAKVASGGELSRTLLAILTASGKARGPHTLVFDEVDAGIGGKPAERVGRRLRDLAANHQVLCITHLPQIAAFAHQHVRVQKELAGARTLVRAKALDPDERVSELARMLAGEQVADTAMLHAQELLRVAQS